LSGNDQSSKGNKLSGNVHEQKVFETKNYDEFVIRDVIEMMEYIQPSTLT